MKSNHPRSAVMADSGGPGSRAVRIDGLRGRNAARAFRKALEEHGMSASVVCGVVHTTVRGTFSASIVQALAERYSAQCSMVRRDRLAPPTPRTKDVQVVLRDGLVGHARWSVQAPAWTGR